MPCHIFHLPSYCVSMLDAYFTHSRTSTCCFDCLVLSSFGQVDGQECLRTSSSYLCFSHLKLYSCCITKFDQVRFEPLCVRSARSPRFVIDLNFQNLFMILGLTDTPLSVLPRSLSWSRFSISVQPIWTFRSHRGSVTARSYESRCHRVVPLGHTDTVRLYIVMGKNLEIPLNPFARAIARSASKVSGSSSRRQQPPVAGLHRHQQDFCPAVAAVASPRRTRVWTWSLCYSSIWFLAHCDHIDSCHVW